MGTGALVISVGAPVGFELLGSIEQAHAQGAQAAADTRAAFLLHRRQCRRHRLGVLRQMDMVTACSSPSARSSPKSSTFRSRP